MAKKFTRSASDKKIAGVCGGLARRFDVDPLWVRIGWVVLTLCSFGIGIVAYLLIWWLADES